MSTRARRSVTHEVRTVITFVVLVAWSVTQVTLLLYLIPNEFQTGDTVPSIMGEAKKVISAVNVLPTPIVAFYFGAAIRDRGPIRWQHALIFGVLLLSVLLACAIVLVRLVAANVGEAAAVSQAMEMAAWLSPNITIPLACLFANKGQPRTPAAE